MSKDNVRLFFEKIISDKQLKEAYEQLSKQHEELLTEKVIELARANGMPFTKAEMRQWINERVKMNKNLSDTKKKTITYIEEKDEKVKFIDEFDYQDEGSIYSFGDWNFVH